MYHTFEQICKFSICKSVFQKIAVSDIVPNSEHYNFFLLNFLLPDRSESLSGALDGCYSYDGEMNQWNLYATLKKPRYRFSHVMINKDTMWLTGKYIF